MKWVRPLISIAMVGGLLYGFIVDKITPTDFLGIAIGAIGWWYISRDKSKTSPPTSSSS